jgi:maleylacetate reductase
VSPGFLWRDPGRVVVFRPGASAEAPELLREHGFGAFELLATQRGLAEVPELEAAALAVHRVGGGQVPEIAAALLDRVAAPFLVAYGGGRVVDTAKAIASVTGAAVAALPTTLSGAEMTGIHRLPAGAEGRVASLTRARLVIADPATLDGLAEGFLRASAVHALAHGLDSLYTPFAHPLSRLAALRGAELIAGALDGEPDRRSAALLEGALLCGYAIDSASFALHHVICQTLVRVCGSPHAETNAVILPEVAGFMASRAPEEVEAFCRAIGTGLAEGRARLRELGGEPAGLGALGADRSRLDEAIESMLARPELEHGPEPPRREDLAELVAAAW